MAFDYIVNWNLEDALKEYGLDEGGRVQHSIDEAFIAMCEKYVPYDEGTLKTSVYENTVLGSGEIVWKTPYARYLYYHPEFDFNGAPTRGAYWAERMIQEGGQAELERIAREEMKK